MPLSLMPPDALPVTLRTIDSMRPSRTLGGGADIAVPFLGAKRSATSSAAILP